MTHDTSNNFRGVPRNYFLVQGTRVSPGSFNLGIPGMSLIRWKVIPWKPSLVGGFNHPIWKIYAKVKMGWFIFPNFRDEQSKNVWETPPPMIRFGSHSGHFWQWWISRWKSVRWSNLLACFDSQTFNRLCVGFLRFQKTAGRFGKRPSVQLFSQQKWSPKKEKNEKKHAQIISNPRNHGVPLCNRESLRCNFSSSNFTRDSKRSTPDKKLDIWLELPQIRRWRVDKDFWIAVGIFALKTRSLFSLYTPYIRKNVFKQNNSSYHFILHDSMYHGMICPTGCGVVGCQWWLADLRSNCI